MYLDKKGKKQKKQKKTETETKAKKQKQKQKQKNRNINKENVKTIFHLNQTRVLYLNFINFLQKFIISDSF